MTGIKSFPKLFISRENLQHQIGMTLRPREERRRDMGMKAPQKVTQFRSMELNCFKSSTYIDNREVTPNVTHKNSG
jgi:hypothetical protein